MIEFNHKAETLEQSMGVDKERITFFADMVIDVLKEKDGNVSNAVEFVVNNAAATEQEKIVLIYRLGATLQ